MRRWGEARRPSRSVKGTSASGSSGGCWRWAARRAPPRARGEGAARGGTRGGGGEGGGAPPPRRGGPPPAARGGGEELRGARGAGRHGRGRLLQHQVRVGPADAEGAHARAAR